MRFIVLLALLIPFHASATFSIVAHDPQTGELGIAVQSRAFSVGGGVPWARARVGAIATQASTNESFGPRGLALLAEGKSAQEVLDALIASDEMRQHRQLAVVDASGNAANWTGDQCMDWAGDHEEPGLSVQGNILAGKAVVDEMVRAFHATDGELAERLLAALHAGQAAGGDTRGMQSAALLIVRPSERYPEYETRYVDLRVEDHASPIEELERVFRIHQASDLLRAHVRYAEEFTRAGDEESAAVERDRMGNALEFTLSREDAPASTLNALAWYCGTGGVFLEQALAAAERAAALEPENSGILDTLAEVQFRLGKVDEALATIERALRLAPGDEYLEGQRERFAGGSAPE